MSISFLKKFRNLLNSPPAGTIDESPLLRYVDRSQLLPREKLLRLGSQYGGWLIPADLRLGDTSVSYLAGAGEDISFDCALASKFHCQVRIFDPTPRAVQDFEQL